MGRRAGRVRTAAALLALGWAALAPGSVAAQGMMPGMGPGAGPMAGMHQHDMRGMPGLQGRDTTPEEVDEMRRMFHHFPAITRSVTKLPDGVRTETGSADPYVRAAVVSHVVGMVTRVIEGRDPEVIIQSPTLDILFARRDAIDTEMIPTETGIVVIQTSADPEVAAALQRHAQEVSEMAARGMAAVHDRMMAQP